MNLSRKLLVLLGLTIIVTLTGCAPPELPYVIPVSEFSFTGIWNEMLDITGAGGNATHLQSFRIDTREDKIDYLSATFSTKDKEGTVMGYTVGSDREGNLQWSGGDVQGEIPERPDYDPAPTFAELDRIGIETIIDNAKSIGIMIDYIYDERSYDYADMYRLENGELRPLREVSFLKDACAATIRITRSYSRNEDTPFAFGRFIGMSEWWFTGEDTGKAETVAFSKNPQEPEFKDFLAGIYGTLPENWHMGLSTREGHMNPPRALEEPLFSLYFKDTVNTFTIENDPTRTDISPSLRLYFYDIADKETIMQVIEQQQKYSWDIPQYYDESPLYLTVTSPVDINSGYHGDEAMQYYESLEQALKEFFEMERQ